jgi:hypothetical protein
MRHIRFATPFETTPAISTGTYFDTFGKVFAALSRRGAI